MIAAFKILTPFTPLQIPSLSWFMKILYQLCTDSVCLWGSTGQELLQAGEREVLCDLQKLCLH